MTSPRQKLQGNRHRVIKEERAENENDLYDATPQPQDTPNELALPPAPAWTPLVIRRLAAINYTLDIPRNPEEFTFAFLRKNLLGTPISPCSYHGNNPASLAKTWNAVNGQYEPFMPRFPGLHGARLSTILALTDEDVPVDNVPLFVSNPGGEYLYYGQYRMPHMPDGKSRWPDRLDYDRMVEMVPQSVLRHKARELAKRDRPAWVHDRIKEYVWPLPDDVEFPLTGAGKKYLDDFDELREEEMGKIDEEFIMNAFNQPEAGALPSLRLSWEYYECIGYDRNFYEKLVTRKRAQP